MSQEMDLRLWEAARDGKLDQIVSLIDGGANVNFHNSQSGNWTSLHFAANNNHLEIVKVLIARGADVHARHQYGSTPLVFAANNGHLEVVQELLRAKSDADVQNSFGNTPLMSAVKTGKLEVVKELVKYGCNLELKNLSGKTALDWATEQNRQDIVNVLAFPTMTANLQANRRTDKVQANRDGNVSEDLIVLRTLFSHFTQLNNSKVKLSDFMQEQAPIIQKYKVKIEIHANECQSLFEQNSEEIQFLEESIQKSDHRISELELELAIEKSKKLDYSLRLEEKKSSFDQNKKMYELAENNKKESQIVMDKLKEIILQTTEIVEKWRNSVQMGEIDSWGAEEMRLVLEEIGLDHWSHELNANNVAPQNINEIFVKDLMSIKKSNGLRFSFGEAYYLKLVFQSIKNKQQIPKILPSVELDPKQVDVWSVDDVFKYFQSQNMSKLASILKDNKINGYVLVRLKQNDTENMDIADHLQRSSFWNDLSKSLNTFNIHKPQSISSVPVPEDFLCPILRSIMNNPVIATDGYIYERDAIEDWLMKSSTSPSTGEEMMSGNFIDAVQIADKIKKWREQNNHIF
eukprot:c11455_g1_i1.p1 GENE.c11455_g1_i1~~c11455_g1_i1.p1  ORF type:complete len:575 (-),score=157.01 c11455_g1_i1:14-1738(-)